MIGKDEVLGIIPARGGSKGVRRKNLRLLAGRPLLDWTAQASMASRFIDRLVLSTDDEEIAHAGRAVGLEVPFLRSADASSDTATAADVVRHALATIADSFVYLVYLQPTSPLRTTADIDGCLELLAESSSDFCASVRASLERPEWMSYMDSNSRLRPVLGQFETTRRQELRSCYVVNGAIYAARVDAFERTGTFLTDETVGYLMPIERSIDIDDITDFDTADRMLRQDRWPLQ